MDGEWRREQDWFWEGSIQAHVLAYLRDVEGFTILSPGEPMPAEQGLEIVAERREAGRSLHRLVSVRGWPSPRYTRGEQAGQLRATRPEVIARSWMAQVVLDLALARGADPDSELCLALPAMASYLRYMQRLRWFLAAARVAVYLVAQDGGISVTPPGATPVSTVPAGREGAEARRKPGLPGATRLQLPLLHALVNAGGSATRPDLIVAVARWFPDVPQPPPAEFGQRLSVAQSTLQVQGWTELGSRGVWLITPAGRAAHEDQWEAWLRKEERTPT